MKIDRSIKSCPYKEGTMEDLRDGQKIAKYKWIEQFASVMVIAVRFTCTELLAQRVVQHGLAVFNTGIRIA